MEKDTAARDLPRCDAKFAAAVIAVLTCLGVGAAEVVMVGDRIETDVTMGKASGLATMLVLSGITRPDDPRIPGLAPDHVIRSVRDILS